MVPKPGQPPSLSCHPWTFGPDLLKSFGGQERRGLEGTVLPSSSRWGRMPTGFSQILWKWLLQGLFQCHLEKVPCSQRCAACPHAAVGPADRSLLCQVLARDLCHQPQPSFPFGCLRNCSNFGLGPGEAGRASQELAGLYLESRALVSQG